MTNELRHFLDRKALLQFWNVVTDEWFKGETIPGSRRVHLDKIGNIENEESSMNLPKSAEIVVYCGGAKCLQSRMAADKLVQLGYETFGL